MKISEISAKTILIKSGLPDADWAINPYVGCEWGCQYCYAAFIGRWKHPDEEWGEFLDIKTNAAEILARDLSRLENKFKTRDFGTILFGSVTDPYTAAEAKYQITRQCLKALVDFGYRGPVSLLTKSPLVVRDIDLFRQLDADVGLTVTSTEDAVSRFLEGRAPAASLRIKALKELHDARIDTYAFVGPLLPYFTARSDKLEKLFSTLKEAGVDKVYAEHLNLSPKIRERLFGYLAKYPDLIPYFKKSGSARYRREIEAMLLPIAARQGIKIIGGKVINHGVF